MSTLSSLSFVYSELCTLDPVLFRETTGEDLLSLLVEMRMTHKVTHSLRKCHMSSYSISWKTKVIRRDTPLVKRRKEPFCRKSVTMSPNTTPGRILSTDKEFYGRTLFHQLVDSRGGTTIPENYTTDVQTEDLKESTYHSKQGVLPPPHTSADVCGRRQRSLHNVVSTCPSTSPKVPPPKVKREKEVRRENTRWVRR